MRFEDTGEALAFGKAMHEKSDMRHLPFDEASAKVTGAQCIVSSAMCAFVAERGGKIVGVLLGLEQPFCHLKARYATDLVFAAQGGAGRKLLDRFLVWALEERNVDQVLMGVTFGGKSAKGCERFYMRRGFRHVGGLFVMDRG